MRITKAEYRAKKAKLDLDKAKLTHTLERNIAVLSRGEEELDEALSLANRLLALWADSDEEGRWKILKTLFVRFTIDDGTITDVELHPPYNFLMRWKPEDTGARIAANRILGLYSCKTSACEGG